jgi:hypothetical protein
VPIIKGVEKKQPYLPVKGVTKVEQCIVEMVGKLPSEQQWNKKKWQPLEL